MGINLIIAESAHKHGVSDEDIRHAYAHPIRVFDLDEGFTMVIGANQAAIVYEIGLIDGVLAPVVVNIEAYSAILIGCASPQLSCGLTRST